MNETAMRELLKDSADDYYVSAFRKINDTGKLTWNWAACCGGSCWLAYRKMYWFGLCYFLLTILPSYTFLKEESLPVHAALLVVSRILLGFYGNSLYYFAVKNRIKEGRHLNEKYKGAHTILLYLNVTLFGAVAALIIWARDKIALRGLLKSRTSFNSDLNEENIRAVISAGIDDHYLGKFRGICAKKLISSNWAAFFGGATWFFCKKMHKYGFAFLVATLAYYAIVLGGDLFILCGEDEKAALAILFSGEFWMKALFPRIIFLLGADRLYYGFCAEKAGKKNIGEQV
ncbi:MAG: DUF2628 domain-containing protein [Holosporaceae bacterium]|jgi:hypothetical protein|nr:DUF2628 domain-containing protein [Holosporaceae bacterium]